MFLQMSGLATTDPVRLSVPLDTRSNLPAQPREIPDPSCYDGRFDGGGLIE
jgi:hypothetical protein